MKVWIDQDLCTGDGLCEEICPEVFTLLDDGLWYVKEKEDEVLPPGSSSNPDYQGTRRIVAVLPRELFPKVEEAAEECPGECIFIEHD